MTKRRGKKYKYNKLPGQKTSKRRWKNLRTETHAKDGKKGKVPRGSDMPYPLYLKSEHWQRKRKAALAYFGYRCWRCGAEDVVLHVHHTHYRDMYREKLEDLRVVCVTCHDKEHGKC